MKAYKVIQTIVVILVVLGVGVTVVSTLMPPVMFADSDDYASGIFASGLFASGIFAAGIFSIGVFSIGIFSTGIFSVGIFSVGVWTLAIFAMGKWCKTKARPEE